jgi:hypothetical protein
MWPHVRTVALQILQTSLPESQQGDLDEIILSTGYPWALQSHENTSDLLAVYAANLRNGGGPGPSYEAFSKMIKAATDGFLINNQLVQTLQISPLAEACAEYLALDDSLPLAKNGTVDYATELLSIAHGRPLRPRALISQLLNSVVCFSEMLVHQFNGTANAFHAAFNQVHPQPAADAHFVFEQFLNISEIPKVGVALAMNFFKDSQVPALKQLPLQDLYSNQIGWFCKPDIHVLRFMLKASGRAAAAGITDESLIHMKESLLRREYKNTPPTKAWAIGSYLLATQRPTSETAQWHCIEDVHRLARHENIPPLEIDRILFMIGSGRFLNEGRIGPQQAERYQLLLDELVEL